MQMVFRCRNRGLKMQMSWWSQWNMRVLKDFTNLSWMYVLIRKDMPFLTRDYSRISEPCQYSSQYPTHPDCPSLGSCKQSILLIKFQTFYFLNSKVKTFFSIYSSFPHQQTHKRPHSPTTIFFIPFMATNTNNLWFSDFSTPWNHLEVLLKTRLVGSDSVSLRLVSPTNTRLCWCCWSGYHTLRTTGLAPSPMFP